MALMRSSSPRHTGRGPTAAAWSTPSTRAPKRRATRTARRRAVPWPSWLPRCTGRGSPGPGLPREEGRRVLEDLALLLETLDALFELAQLLALGAGQPVIALAAVAAALPARGAQSPP